jgi:hypothetical protein
MGLLNGGRACLLLNGQPQSGTSAPRGKHSARIAWHSEGNPQEVDRSPDRIGDIAEVRFRADFREFEPKDVVLGEQNRGFASKDFSLR